MKIYTLHRAGTWKEFERLRRKRRGEWQFLMSGWWVAAPMSEIRCSVLFSHSPDRIVWALLEAGSRRRIVAVCEVDPATRTEEVLAAMLRQLDADTGMTFELADDERSVVDFDEVWRLYAGATALRKSSIGDAPLEHEHSKGPTDNVVPLRRPRPGEKFDLEEVRRMFGFVQSKMANWKAMQEASLRRSEVKAKRRRKKTPPER